MRPRRHAAFAAPSPLSTAPSPRCRPQFTTHTAPTASLPPPQLSRRSLISLLPILSLPLLPAESQTFTTPPPPNYDANKSRRYIPIGRPAPDRAAPTFKTKPFSIDPNLQAEDLRIGTGALVEAGSLVVAKWVMLLDDGTTLDDANEELAAYFRPGAHQVVPGVEDGVVGMREGGKRRVRGSAERVLTSVRMGYDIGERSLVPNEAVVFLDIQVDRVNPYGR
eukprot:GFKZ01002308.1.p1 GENE.GFKZ01002308.1~~GFKZ01002308.1.p1  ORF type:complete len:222 (-),score=23.27 GFKZ01002308.1:303-968(-)